MTEKLKNESGVITIEATISLSAFMFAIITILTLINICIVQAKVTNAINATAKEISQYTYLYSLMGLNTVQGQWASQADFTSDQINGVIGSVKSTFTELDGLGKDLKGTGENISQFADGEFDVNALEKNIDNLTADLDKMQGYAGQTIDQLEAMAENPKQLIFGLASMGASDAWDILKSRIIATNLANVMCRKHFIEGDKDEVNRYLASLGVVQQSNGSYIDFSNSTIFPRGSNIITISAEYDVKIIALLPIDLSFHFSQTAITYGWMCGEDSSASSDKTAEKYITEENSTLWTQASVTERSDYIRHMAIANYKDFGFYVVSGSDQGLMYNPETNESIMVGRSINPLYSEPGSDPMTVDDIDEEFVKSQISKLCGQMNQNRGANTVTIKKEVNGETVKETVSCAEANMKIVIVIPEDEGLLKKMQSIAASSELNGVEIEFVPSYGNGVSATTTKSSATDAGGE